MLLMQLECLCYGFIYLEERNCMMTTYNNEYQKHV
jgi:hypothetical protein